MCTNYTSNLKDDGGSNSPAWFPFDMGNRHAGKTGGGSLAFGARARQPCVEARSFGAPLTFRRRRFGFSTTTSLCADWGTRLFQGGLKAGADDGRFCFGTLVDWTEGIHSLGGVFGPSSFLCSFSAASFREISRDCSSCFFLRLAFASAAKSLCKPRRARCAGVPRPSLDAVEARRCRPFLVATLVRS